MPRGDWLPGSPHRQSGGDTNHLVQGPPDEYVEVSFSEVDRFPKEESPAPSLGPVSQALGALRERGIKLKTFP